MLGLYIYISFSTAILDEIHQLKSSVLESGSSKKACIALQRALIRCQEIGDEKIVLVQIITDLIENRSRQLEQDREHLGQLRKIHCILNIVYLVTLFV